MWLTDVMMILFAGAMVSLMVDMGKRFYGGRRQFISGAVAIAATAVSLAIVLAEWFAETASTTQISPASSSFATLYAVDSFTLFIIVTELSIGLVIAYFSTVYLTPRDNSGPFFALPTPARKKYLIDASSAIPGFFLKETRPYAEILIPSQKRKSERKSPAELTPVSERSMMSSSAKNGPELSLGVRYTVEK